MGDLPGRLSEHQQFILAYILYRERGSVALRKKLEDTVPISARSMLEFSIMGVETVSRALAFEFDRGGERITVPPEPLEERIERLLDEGKTDVAEFLATAGSHLERQKRVERRIQPSHSAAFSRSLSRLEERGLVICREGHGQDEPTRVSVQLTPDGREAAEEILRRHTDGRYSLSFETLD